MIRLKDRLLAPLLRFQLLHASAASCHVPVELAHPELLFGQYWSMFCEYYSEMAEDGPLQMTGTPTARLPQIRLTQKFLGDWTVAGLIGDPNRPP